MESYIVSVRPPSQNLDSALFRKLCSQLQKDLFIAVRAFDVSVTDLAFNREKFVFRASGRFTSINSLMTFVLLRMSEKSRQVLYRSYSLLKTG